MIEDLIIKHEGRVYWMYLDTERNVTVGVGHLLRTAADAAKVFGRDVTDDFLRVYGMVSGHEAGYYKYQNCPMLSEDQVMALLDADIALASEGAKTVIPDFDQLPEQAQAVVIDMVFNLGQAGFASFHNTDAAIGSQNWSAVVAGMQGSLWYKQVPERSHDDVALIQQLIAA